MKYSNLDDLDLLRIEIEYVKNARDPLRTTNTHFVLHLLILDEIKASGFKPRRIKDKSFFVRFYRTQYTSGGLESITKDFFSPFKRTRSKE